MAKKKNDVKEFLRRYIAVQKKRMDATDFEMDKIFQRHCVSGAIDFALYAKLIDFDDYKELWKELWDAAYKAGFK